MASLCMLRCLQAEGDAGARGVCKLAAASPGSAAAWNVGFATAPA